MKPIFYDARYKQLAADNRESYRSADPFPHAVFDQFLPAAACQLLLDEFPGGSDIDWISFDDSRGKKSATRDERQFGSHTRQILHQFNSASFLDFLQLLTGIEGLIGDPGFEGGGLHEIGPGGFLKIHADFNRHENLKLDRRINALLFLNPDWKDEYGGHLELWDRSMSRCVKKILPVMNRCVVFDTTDFSFHGHPDPLTCPPGMTRRSLALYYYSNGRPEQERSAAHSTLYQHRPDERRYTVSPRYRLRRLLADVLDKSASLADKPVGLLRRTASKVRPPEYSP